jgi:hypothetical protein
MTMDSTTDLLELVEMADMYTSKCTRQEEKFDYYRRNGIAWSWQDCEAAWQLLRELPYSWALHDAWRKHGARGVDMWRATPNVYETDEYWAKEAKREVVKR